MPVDPAALAEGVNLLWVLVVTFLIFFMHAGFAMLEAGQVRSKNVANQLTKNMLTWSVGVVLYFLVGAAIATVTGQLTGPASLDVAGSFSYVNGGSDAWVSWLFGAVFAMTAATIVSGAVAGRAKLRAYVGYTVLLAGVIYPVVVGFTWGGGILAELGFHDFAGGMIVHGMGGLAGLAAAWVLGPRIDRYRDDGTVNVIPGHSLPFAVLGTLILAFGWYGFNVGTAATVFSPGAAEEGTLALGAFGYVGRVALVTTLGMASGALGAASVSLYKTTKVDTLYVANGMLAGLVGITGIADAIVWPGAVLVGGLAGVQLPIVFEFVEKRLQIDDVCAVFPVHGSAGVLGTLMFPLVATSGANASFVAQLAGVVLIGGWTVVATIAVFGAFRLFGQARVSEQHERDGLDVTEHGVDTYPEFGKPDLATDGGRSVDHADSSMPVYRADGGTDSTSPRGPSGIELVMAFIRPDKLGDVKTELANAGAPSLTVTNVSGRGSQPAKKGQWRGEEYSVDLHQKVKVECVVADVPAADVVDAIREGAHTGEKGDGKVFVLPVDYATQIRTGKEGIEAV